MPQQMVPFNMTRDINGFNGFGVKFSNFKYQGFLVANVDQYVVVPPTSNSMYQHVLVLFSYDPGSSVWVALNTPATVATGIFLITDSELNPSARYVKTGDLIHMITAGSNIQVGMSFYAVT